MNFQEVFNIINYSSALSVAIPLICCILRFKTLNNELRVLFVYIIISVLTEVIGYVSITSNIHTYLINHLFTIFECSIFTFIYYNRFESKRTRIRIISFYAFFLFLAFTILLLKGGYNRQDNIISTYEAAFLIALSSGYFLKLMNELNIPKLKEFYFAWLNSAILIYFSMAFFLFLFNGYIEERGLKTYNKLYSLHWITNIAFNILLANGIWKIKHK